MNKINTNANTNNSFFKEHKELLIVGGTMVVLVGAGFTWYYFKKKKEHALALPSSKGSSLDAKMTSLSTRITANTKADKETSGTIKFGSRHPNVMILQRYLKIYKEDIGTTGPKRDGVDGIFGPKTARGAKKHLGKAIFTQTEIEGMRKALKSMGK